MRDNEQKSIIGITKAIRYLTRTQEHAALYMSLGYIKRVPHTMQQPHYVLTELGIGKFINSLVVNSWIAEKEMKYILDAK